MPTLCKNLDAIPNKLRKPKYLSKIDLKQAYSGTCAPSEPEVYGLSSTGVEAVTI